MGNNQYGQYYPNYSQNNYGAGYQYAQPQTRQNVMQPAVQTQQELPFNDVRYGTIDEAKGHLVAPNTAVMFINRNLGEFYVKSANQMGEPLLETFKYSKLDNNVVEQKPVAIDTSQFVKSQDLENYITKEDIKGLVVEIDKLKKQLEISKIEKGEFKNGK
jgi:uncharacterized protein with NAD-binding domain and iron-sulfur cluster